MSRITATRYHDIAAGHRVSGHESKCRHLHGHGYRIHFHCEGDLDKLGRVMDFGVIKERLCMWVEDNWDHKFLMWKDDPLWPSMQKLPGMLKVPFNPTAENMAQYLLEVVGPEQLSDSNVTLTKVVIDETRKCSAEAYL